MNTTEDKVVEINSYYARSIYTLFSDLTVDKPPNLETCAALTRRWFSDGAFKTYISRISIDNEKIIKPDILTLSEFSTKLAKNVFVDDFISKDETVPSDIQTAWNKLKPENPDSPWPIWNTEKFTRDFIVFDKVYYKGNDNKKLENRYIQ
jgi:hypothetical protein